MNAKRTSAISKLTFGALLFIAVIAVQSFSPASVAGDNSALVKYQGIQDDMVIFNVTYKNPAGSSFSVIIEDQDKTQLYQSTFKDKDFSKTFRLPQTDRSKISFVIRNFKDADFTKTFEININSRLVADVAVKKLN